MISGERSSRLTTKIELVEVRELTESTDWFLPFHLKQRPKNFRGVRVVARATIWAKTIGGRREKRLRGH
jgi:hypothetical protein